MEGSRAATVSPRKWVARGRRWSQATVLGLAMAIGGVLFSLSPPGIVFEETVGLSWLFLLRGPMAPPAEVAVIALDKGSATSLGLPAQPRRWPRSFQAQIIAALDHAGASVIAVDLILNERTRPAEDAALATAISEAGRVVLFEYLERRHQPLRGASDPKGGLWLERTLAPVPELARAAAAVAPFPLPKVGASVRQFWTFKGSAGDAPTMPSVALQIHALDAYQNWINHLEGEGVLAIGQVPFLAGRLYGKLDDAMRATRGASRALFAGNALPTADQVSPLARSIAGLLAGPSSHYLNFYGPPGTIPVIPFAEVISPQRADRDALRSLAGKAVFVGVAELEDPDQPDGFYSVFTGADGVDLSGVEIAATAFANILSQRTIAVPAAAATAGLLTITGLILGLSAALLPAMVAVPAAIAAAAIYALATQAVFNRFDLWLPLATPLLLQLPLAVFLGILGQYLLAHRQRERMSRAISYYLPEKVATGLREGYPIKPGDLGETVYATCLASDLENFTAIAETMSPQEVASYLNDYFAAVAEPIKRRGADVLEFRADGMMCAWTGDATRAGDHARACEAALDVVAAVRRFEVAHGGGRHLPTRLGIHAGWIYVGHAGGGGRYAYSIIGDIANTASRIEGLNKLIGTALLISQIVAAPLAKDFLLRPVGRFRLRGKVDAIAIVEVMGAKADASPAAAALCARFAEALARYQDARWDRAAAAFADIARDYPDDGPTAFYHRRSLALVRGETSRGDPTIIRVDEK